MDAQAASARLAELDRALARLREQCEIAMSAFRFDEASRVNQRIAAAEAERRLLALSLPPAAPTPPSEPVSIAGPASRRLHRGRRTGPRRPGLSRFSR